MRKFGIVLLILSIVSFALSIILAKVGTHDTIYSLPSGDVIILHSIEGATAYFNNVVAIEPVVISENRILYIALLIAFCITFSGGWFIVIASYEKKEKAPCNARSS